MKLIEYKTQKWGIRSEPSISFSKKGVITINKLAAELLSLASGEKVAFYQDSERPMDWYIKKNHEGVPVRAYSAGNGLLCNCALVCKEVLASVKKDRAVIKLAKEPVDGLYAILTKSI